MPTDTYFIAGLDVMSVAVSSSGHAKKTAN
jgi:hypothetical protein